MGQTLSEPVTEKETAHCHNDDYSVSNKYNIYIVLSLNILIIMMKLIKDIQKTQIETQISIVVLWTMEWSMAFRITSTYIEDTYYYINILIYKAEK